MRTPEEETILKGIKELHLLGVIIGSFDDRCGSDKEKESYACLDECRYNVRLYINPEDNLTTIEAAILKAHSLLLTRKDIIDHEENHPQFRKAIKSVIYNLPIND